MLKYSVSITATAVFTISHFWMLCFVMGECCWYKNCLKPPNDCKQHVQFNWVRYQYLNTLAFYSHNVLAIGVSYS